MATAHSAHLGAVASGRHGIYGHRRGTRLHLQQLGSCRELLLKELPAFREAPLCLERRDRNTRLPRTGK
eukprot:15446480-Alexandrium_andersonii.AAC.2